MMKPLISIQILNWNRADETQRAIASAYAQTYPNIEVVVVDNGSTDNSVELTKLNFPDAKVIELDNNYGCPGGRNRGIDYCEGDYIFYLDNDGVLHKDAVQLAYETISSFDNIGVVAGVVYDFDDVREIDTEFPVERKGVYYSNSFQGGICLHDKAIYKNVGNYPDHFIYGSEERYLSLKLFDESYEIMKNESVILWHKRSQVQRDRTAELLNGFYNKLYTAVVLYPTKQMLLFILYFVFIYPFYSFRNGFSKRYFKTFVSRFFSTLRKGLRNRDAVSLKAYNKYKNSLTKLT